LIIGSLSAAALNTLNLNKVKGTIKVCNILPPQFGYKSHELMADIAIATGAKYFSESTGDNLELIKFEDLGRAHKAIVSRSSTVLIKDTQVSGGVESRIAEMWDLHDGSDSVEEKQFIKERMAILSGGVAVIHVGANSEIEQKEKRDRVDDAVCATRAALEGGILPGGGIALLRIAEKLSARGANESQLVANVILSEAIRSPFCQILVNAGLDPAVIRGNLSNGDGYDVKAQKYGNMLTMGIIDPVKVTVNALENAVSVATTILSTNAIITNVRDYEGSR
jgi:chaperonin GroEL